MFFFLSPFGNCGAADLFHPKETFTNRLLLVPFLFCIFHTAIFLLGVPSRERMWGYA
ncbi:hypothetical protein BDZ45DRAFT_787986, partial [Acephala macrosclerotiorum]